MESPYYDEAAMTEAVRQGRHREMIGGRWEEIGPAQLSFLKKMGLRPSDFLLDIGCGCLRGGVHLIPYLDPGHYFGTDINAALLEAGWRIELSQLLQDRM